MSIAIDTNVLCACSSVRATEVESEYTCTNVEQLLDDFERDVALWSSQS